MSNYLAIATVTAALKSLLIEHVGPDIIGADVTTKRPTAPSGGVAGPSINIYMYQVSPNQAWSNRDVRTRRPQEGLIKHGQAALDLSYLFSFYGDESQLIPQKLLGSTIRTLIDNPQLDQQTIRDSIASSEVLGLDETTLEDQIQLVKFVPSVTASEPLSQVWSTFCQVPYSLSFVYQATAVLIEGKQTGRAALPVRRRAISVAQNRPVIEKIDPQSPAKAITLASSLVVRGQQLTDHGDANSTAIRIGNSYVRPKVAQASQILLQFPQLTDIEIAALRPGVQGLQVVQMAESSSPGRFWKPKKPESTMESNVVPFVLCPTIVDGSRGLIKSNIFQDFIGNSFSGLLLVKTDLAISADQRVFLLLNRISGESAKDEDNYIFSAVHRDSDTTLLEFALSKVTRGEFLVRIQVDGAESPLIHNGERYSGPSLAVGL